VRGDGSPRSFPNHVLFRWRPPDWATRPRLPNPVRCGPEEAARFPQYRPLRCPACNKSFTIRIHPSPRSTGPARRIDGAGPAAGKAAPPDTGPFWPMCIRRPICTFAGLASGPQRVPLCACRTHVGPNAVADPRTPTGSQVRRRRWPPRRAGKRVSLLRKSGGGLIRFMRACVKTACSSETSGPRASEMISALLLCRCLTL
jgi:hypothetical protein